MAWLKHFLKQWGPLGAVSVALLIVVAQNAGLLPSAREVFSEPQRPPASPARENGDTLKLLQRHTAESAEQTGVLRDIRDQLQKNRDTQAIGLRRICIGTAKTQDALARCAEIQ